MANILVSLWCNSYKQLLNLFSAIETDYKFMVQGIEDHHGSWCLGWLM